MNQQALTRTIEETLESCKKLLDVKGREYSDHADRLANFKRGSMLTKLSPEQVLFVYMSKHYDAIATYTQMGQIEGGEDIYGRLKDLINYCLLMTALIAERGNNMPQQAGSGQSTGVVYNPLDKLRKGQPI